MLPSALFIISLFSGVNFFVVNHYSYHFVVVVLQVSLKYLFLKIYLYLRLGEIEENFVSSLCL